MHWAPERDTGNTDGSRGPAVFVLDHPPTLANLGVVIQRGGP